MATIMTRAASRRMSKPLSPNLPRTRQRSARIPISIVLSDSDDDDVIFIKSPSPPLIDLTRPVTPPNNRKPNHAAVTPPNNRKPDNIPVTPSDRPTNPVKMLVTPTVLLEQLDLGSPVNLRSHREGRESDLESEVNQQSSNATNLQNRRELFKLISPRKKKTVDNTNQASPPKQKKKNHENSQSPSKLDRSFDENSPSANRRLFKENDVYLSARRALHSASPTEMPGREQELGELRKFIETHLEEETSGSLYVSGPPGTGKTAALNVILNDETIASKLKHVCINCTAIKSSGAIYSRIVLELGIKSHGKTEKDCRGAIEQYLATNHKTILLVLDEIDQLESKRQSVLYTIFEWPSNRKFRLILVGIANALDLTDRILPRLQAHCALKPHLVHFAPYTKQQIIEIFTSRLKAADVLKVFTPSALQMLAGKVAAISGDVRRALDIGRRVVELVDNDVLQPLENCGKSPKSVDLKRVMEVLNNVYGASQNFGNDCEDSFPLQQKIVVCSLVLMLKKAKNKDVTVGRLHEVYRKVCGKRNIQAVDQGEFVGLCSLIETKGILRVIRKKDPRMSKVSLTWDEEEVANALKDKQLMSTILQDEGCLGKI